MRAGQLDQRVTIQGETRTDDGGGGVSIVWADLATVWARVEPLSGRERLQAAQLESSVTYRVIIRRRTDVTAGMRLVWQGRPMQIRAVVDAGPRSDVVTLDCEQGVAT